jgi:CRISPR system Cascade subunit CasC
MVTLRCDQPVNLVGAFEDPVVSRDGGYVKLSAGKLSAYAKNVYENFAGKPCKAWTVGDLTVDGADKIIFADLLTALEEEIKNGDLK